MRLQPYREPGARDEYIEEDLINYRAKFKKHSSWILLGVFSFYVVALTINFIVLCLR